MRPHDTYLNRICLHTGERIQKPPYSVPEKAGYVWAEGTNVGKKLCFLKYLDTCGRHLIACAVFRL